jgi:hypothetical protein
MIHLFRAVVYRDSRGHKVTKVSRVLTVYKVHKDFKAQQVLLEHKVRKARKVRRDFRVYRVGQESKVLQALLGHKV